MKSVVVGAAVVLTVAVRAGEISDDSARSRDPAAGEVLTPRPGAAVRATVGTAAPHVPGDGRVVDDRIIVEERAPSVTPENCIAGATRAACAR
jgi:hypothetical protein